MIKKLFTPYLALFFLASSSLEALGPSSNVISPSIGGTSSTPSSTMQGSSPSLSPLPSREPNRPANSPTGSQEPLRRIQPKPTGPAIASYFHPGLVLNRGGGGDHLYNLTNNLSVYTTILKPEKENLDFTEESLRALIEDLFNKQGINPQTIVEFDQPALPFFHLQVLVYPIERGYAACCSARLFESVILKRFQLEPGTSFQAVTWERDTLLVAPRESVRAQVEKALIDMTQIFLEQYQYYERLRASSSRP